MIFLLTAAEIEQHLEPLKNSHFKEKKCFSFKEEYEIHSSNTEKRNRETSTLRQREGLLKLPLFKKDSFHQSNFPIEQVPTLPIEL